MAQNDETKVVIQVSSDDTASLAVNNVANLLRAMGDQVTVEVVAFGPGIGLVDADGPLAGRVADLVDRGVVFSACENTLNAVASRTGAPLTLVDGVGTVASGIARVVELQSEGYIYVRP